MEDNLWICEPAILLSFRSSVTSPSHQKHAYLPPSLCSFSQSQHRLPPSIIIMQSALHCPWNVAYISQERSHLKTPNCDPTITPPHPGTSADVNEQVFNSRTCQLVLGAGAMQTTGLKSISAKHLALTCQCLAALIALHPALVHVFTSGVARGRRALLTPEFERALQVRGSTVR